MKAQIKSQLPNPSPTRPKSGKPSRGKRVLAALLHGGKIRGRTQDWLHLTRGAA